MRRIDRKSPIPLHHQLRRELEQEILFGKWAPGEALPTEEEFCAQLGISRTTVRRAIMDLVQQGLLERIPSKGTFVTDRGSTRRTIVIAAFGISRLHGPGAELFVRMWEGIESAAQRADLHIVVRRMENSASDEEKAEFLNLLTEDPETLGIALFTWNAVTWRQVHRLQESGFPYVLINRYIPGHETPSVTLDDRGAVFFATRRLFELGHRNIALVSFDNPASTAREDREQGYWEAMHALGLSDKASVFTADLTAPSRRDAVFALLKTEDRPTAMVVLNGTVAAGLATEAEILGLRIPGDLSIVGFDDCNRLTERTPGITAMDYAPVQFGATAVDVILRQAGGDMSVRTRHVCRSKMIERGSCAPLSPSNQRLHAERR